MSLFSLLKNYFIKYRYNKTDERKREWLRSLGARIGDGTRFVGNANLGSEPYLVQIGKNCLVSSNVLFSTHDGSVKVLNGAGYFNGENMDKIARIKVGDNCFLGNGCRLMGGVIIGDNVIIGAGSVVTKNIPSNTVAAGMPAKVICTIDEFYEKNKERGVYYPTPNLSYTEKKKYLMEHVPEL